MQARTETVTHPQDVEQIRYAWAMTIMGNDRPERDGQGPGRKAVPACRRSGRGRTIRHGEEGMSFPGRAGGNANGIDANGAGAAGMAPKMKRWMSGPATGKGLRRGGILTTFQQGEG